MDHLPPVLTHDDPPPPKPQQATPSRPDQRKQSLYFPAPILSEIRDEAARMDRSLSWVVQRAWEIGAPHIRQMPGKEAYVTPGVASSGGTGSAHEQPIRP